MQGALLCQVKESVHRGPPCGAINALAIAQQHVVKNKVSHRDKPLRS